MGGDLYVAATEGAVVRVKTYEMKLCGGAARGGRAGPGGRRAPVPGLRDS